MPASNPPALPAQLTRPDAQMVVDALNLRLHAVEEENALGFLKLVTAGSHKVAFGETTVTWTASTESAIKTVEHGLGIKPIVSLTLEAGTSSVIVQLQTIERTSSVFKVFGKASTALSSTGTVMWIAVA